MGTRFDRVLKQRRELARREASRARRERREQRRLDRARIADEHFTPDE
jgi:hypothetical protein